MVNMKIQREGINTVIVIQDEGAGHIQADKEDGTRAELPRRGSAHNIRHRTECGEHDNAAAQGVQSCDCRLWSPRR